MYTIKTEENPKPTYMEYRFTFTSEQQTVVKNDFYSARNFILNAGIENFQLDETDQIQSKMKSTVLKAMAKTKPAKTESKPNTIDPKPDETKALPVSTPVSTPDSAVFINRYTDSDGTEITVVTNAPEYCNPLIIK